VPIRRARDHAALHDAIADHDLAVVPDGPLASVIARRVEAPQLGHVAATPSTLAGPRTRQRNDRHEGFLAACRATDLDWQTASLLVDRALECWTHTGRVDAILEHDRYDTAETMTVVEVLADLETTRAHALDEYEIPRGQSVAVVGEPLLTPLQRSILPAEYENVDPFTDGDFELPTFHLFDSRAAIVDAVLDAIEPANADDVAVVCPGKGQYATLVEAGLEASGVEYHGGPAFLDDPDRRALLGLLRTIHAGSGTLVRTVRPLLRRLGIPVPIDHDDKRLGAIDVRGLGWLSALRDAADPSTSEAVLTLADVLRAYEDNAATTLPDLRHQLDELWIADAPATTAAVDRLAFYLQSYDVPVDREDGGVLIADAASATHVDRPLVFHLGLDDGWMQEVPRRPWIDEAAAFERDVARFELMLQSGTDRYYFVRDSAGGEPVAPCAYLRERYDGVERFEDFETAREVRRFGDPGIGFDHEPVPATDEPVDVVSQSTLKRFANSPRDHLFSRLVDGPDRDYFEEGTLFHDFAEFYASNPDAIDGADLADVASFMVEETAPYYPDDERPLRRARYRAGLETVLAFFEERPPEPVPFLTRDTGWGSNVFADRYDGAVGAPTTERWFENRDVGLKGMIDIVYAPNRLVDYKSGRQKRPSEVVRHSAVDPPGEKPDFQALAYLAHWRTVRPGERLEFTFFHFLAALDDAITGEVDLGETLTTTTYYPEPFAEFVASQAAYDVLRDGYRDCVETFEVLGYEAYAEIAERHATAESVVGDPLGESAFAADFAADVARAVGDDAEDPAKGADQAIRALDGVRRRNYFREDVDAFESFVEDRIAELNRYRAGLERAPVAGPGGEVNFDRVGHRDLLLEGEDG